MNTCSTCQWWYYDPDDSGKEKEWGSCELASSDDGGPEHPESKAVARDDEAWSAWLNTRPDFGCNQWEIKEMVGNE